MLQDDGCTPAVTSCFGSLFTNVHRDSGGKFNEVKLNYRGHIHYALMIKKLCEFNHRREFILRILENVIKTEDDDAQIMILGHNKVLLIYLFRAVQCNLLFPLLVY